MSTDLSALPAVPRTEPRRRVQLLASSPALRTALRRALSARRSPYCLTPEFADPSDALRAVGETHPDALVLDTELTGLRGLSLLRQIGAADPSLPIVVVAPATQDDHTLRAEAVELGAVGVCFRPQANEPLALRPVAREIIAMLERAPTRAASTVPPAPCPPTGAVRTPAGGTAQPAGRHRSRQPGPPQALLVASSTGGPQALLSLFSRLSPAAVSVPVLVVQHMPAAFTPILAEHLSRATAWRAVEARDDEALTPGEVRIAPGGHHMVVAGTAASRRLRLTSSPPVNFCRPSADVLFVSAAEVFGRGVLAVILTGMGSDGCAGAKVISAAGGRVYAQDRETSVVWGMPGAAVGAGVVDRVFPLEAMAGAIQAIMVGAP